MAETRKRAKSTGGSTFDGFTDAERAAMKAHGDELRKAARRGSAANKEEGEADVLAKIAEMTGTDRDMAERVHSIATTSAPDLTPRLYYGMPAYAKDGKVVFWFKSAAKFKTRFATLGFSDKANLDDGAMWPTEYALMRLTAAEEARISALVKQAAS